MKSKIKLARNLEKDLKRYIAKYQKLQEKSNSLSLKIDVYSSIIEKFGFVVSPEGDVSLQITRIRTHNQTI